MSVLAESAASAELADLAVTCATDRTCKNVCGQVETTHEAVVAEMSGDGESLAHSIMLQCGGRD